MHKLPKVQLGEVADRMERPVTPVPGREYRQIGVRLWGEGAYERETMDGAETTYAKLFRAEAGDIIMNKIWARNGSVAVVPPSLAGCFGSGEFPMFSPKPDRLDSQWMHWLTKTRGLWAQCDEKSQGTSGKNRIKPEQFLCVEIPLPPLSEQRRIVARIEKLAAKIEEARRLRLAQGQEVRHMLLGAFWQVAKDAPRQTMRDIAPQVRRPAQVNLDGIYPELGIRSFGKGTFHKPSLSGAEIGDKRIFWIEPGDLLFSNVFAWEGAIAVARPADQGRVGSHRYITCVPKKEIATATFLCFYFLTDEGLDLIRGASPGGAGRNRTLGLTALDMLQVPVPAFSKQRWFDALQFKMSQLRNIQADTASELDALLPSVLDKAFKGEL